MLFLDVFRMPFYAHLNIFCDPLAASRLLCEPVGLPLGILWQQNPAQRHNEYSLVSSWIPMGVKRSQMEPKWVQREAKKVIKVHEKAVRSCLFATLGARCAPPCSKTHAWHVWKGLDMHLKP